ncbi:MAG: tetratricopeptide repeat protein [Opitutales bacterium]
MTTTTPAIDTKEITLEEMDPRLRKQLDNARKNLAKNPAYAVDLAADRVSRFPGDVEFRKLLFEARQRQGSAKSSGLTKLFSSVTKAPFQMKGAGQLKKDPAAALTTAEKMIANAPNDASGYKLLGDAALALQMPQTAVVALENANKLAPDDTDAMLSLGNAYLEAGRAQDAVKMGDAIIRATGTSDERAADLVRRGSVAATQKTYEKAESFREVLADKDEAQQLEEASRAHKDDDTLRKELNRNKETLETNPEDINLYRRIIDAHQKLGEYEEAIEYVQKALQTPNGKGDPTLERLEADLRESVLQRKLEEKEAALEANPDDASAQQGVNEAKEALKQFQIESSEKMVERYPNDYHARFRLGQLYYEAGEYDKAIGELQRAQRNPQVRVRAILMTGKAMLHKGMGDLAVAQLASAKGETPIMNDLKKEIIYELGRAYEAAGDKDKAIAEYKEIYAADIGFRDVADKINQFYSKS